MAKNNAMVGVIRFERTTSPSRTVRATGLRHTPMVPFYQMMVTMEWCDCQSNSQEPVVQMPCEDRAKNYLQQHLDKVR